MMGSNISNIVSVDIVYTQVKKELVFSNYITLRNSITKQKRHPERCNLDIFRVIVNRRVLDKRISSVFRFLLFIR